MAVMHKPMRTTLDLDDALMAGVQARFPPGTPKTVMVEEGLRRLLVPPDGASQHPDPRLQSLISAGVVYPARRLGSYRRDAPSAPIPLAQLLADLDRDREDR